MAALTLGHLPMKYAVDFFDLQIRFAQRVTEMSGLSLERALLDYTNIYVRLGLGRRFDSHHPLWVAYVAGLRASDDITQWTHRFYLSRPQIAPPGLVAQFGCFAYARQTDDCVRIHFENRQNPSVSPLSDACRDARRDDLRALFVHVGRQRPKIERVAGVSWLYNLPAYRRLFPEAYLASAKVARARFRHMPLWGQFLDRRGQVRENGARRFRERFARHERLEDLDDCFPLQPLALEASIAAFYAFHGLA